MAKLSGLTLLLETTKGIGIGACATEAVHIADVLQITVRFVFNDLLISASPGESPAVVVSRYSQAHQRRLEMAKAR